MEDFAREIDAGSALFILYGDAGVGKSRVLQEWVTNRLVNNRVHGQVSKGRCRKHPNISAGFTRLVADSA